MKNFLKKYWKTALAAAAVLALLIFAVCLEKNRRNLQADNDQLRHNIVAMQDTVRTVRMKNGELLSTISGYVSDIGELKLYSENLQNIVDNYKAETGNKVTAAITSEAEIVLPEKEVIFYRDTTVRELHEKFDFSDKYRTLTGTLTVDSLSAGVQLDPEIVWARFTAGVDEKNNVFVTTDNPYIRITDLEGFTVPKPRQKRWGLGVHAGYGFQFGTNKLGPQISIGLNYNILSF